MRNIANETKVEASDHLYYEYWMMKYCHSILTNKGISQIDSTTTSTSTSTSTTTMLSYSTGIIKTENGEEQNNYPIVLSNAIIESFAIHLRSLLDFFYKEPRNDDVAAGDYFPTPEVWKNICPRKTIEDIEAIRKRVNKEVAHLTYYRQTVVDKTWALNKYYEEIAEIFEVFKSNATEQLLSSRWKN